MKGLSLGDTIKLQIEFYRTRAREMPTDMRAAVAMEILGHAFTKFSRRRKKADNQTREILRQAMREVWAEQILEYDRQLKRWGI